MKSSEWGAVGWCGLGQGWQDAGARLAVRDVGGECRRAACGTIIGERYVSLRVNVRYYIVGWFVGILRRTD